MEEDPRLFPQPLQIPATTGTAIYATQLNESPQLHRFAASSSFNHPQEPNPFNQVPGPRSPSDTEMRGYPNATTRRESKGKGPAIKNEAFMENEALQSLIKQLDRIELQGQSSASKANFESLETRVRHLEQAVHSLLGSHQAPGLPGPNQTPGTHDEVIINMVSLSFHVLVAPRY